MKLRLILSIYLLSIGLIGYSQKVVGGQNAGQYEYKFLVGLGYKNGITKNPEEHFCGGSLIRQDWILTAAHCLYDDNGNPLKANEIFAFLNVWQLDNPNPEMEQYNITKIIMHANYDDFSSDNDIALLRISGKSNLNLITLPAQNNESLLIAGKKCTVAGWGATNNSGTQYPTIQQKVELEVISNTTCNQSSWYDGEVLQSMLCAGYAAGQKDACYGDSGGPLFVMENGDTTQIGVVSWGYGCAEAKQPGVYTKVSNYINWINTNIAAATVGVELLEMDAICKINGNQGKILLESNANTPLLLAVNSIAGSRIGEINLEANEASEINLPAGAYVVSSVLNGTKIVKKIIVW